MKGAGATGNVGNEYGAGEEARKGNVGWKSAGSGLI